MVIYIFLSCICCYFSLPIMPPIEDVLTTLAEKCDSTSSCVICHLVSEIRTSYRNAGLQTAKDGVSKTYESLPVRKMSYTTIKTDLGSGRPDVRRMLQLRQTCSAQTSVMHTRQAAARQLNQTPDSQNQTPREQTSDSQNQTPRQETQMSRQETQTSDDTEKTPREHNKALLRRQESAPPALPADYRSEFHAGQSSKFPLWTKYRRKKSYTESSLSANLPSFPDLGVVDNAMKCTNCMDHALQYGS